MVRTYIRHFAQNAGCFWVHSNCGHTEVVAVQFPEDQDEQVSITLPWSGKCNNCIERQVRDYLACELQGTFAGEDEQKVLATFISRLCSLLSKRWPQVGPVQVKYTKESEESTGSSRPIEYDLHKIVLLVQKADEVFEARLEALIKADVATYKTICFSADGDVVA